MTRTNLAVAADYADAMLTAQFWKKLLFALLYLLLLVQLGVFFAVRYVTTSSGGATTVTATSQPAAISGRDLSVPLAWLINTVDFVAIITVIVLAIVLLLIVGIMLVGRLVGVTHLTRAFIRCVVLGVLLFPWQSLWDYPLADSTGQTAEENVEVGPRFGLPGVLYTWPELRHRAHFESSPPTAAVLGWARFVGWPVAAIILLFSVQVLSSKGLKLALGETEVHLETGTATGAGERGT